MWSVFFFGFFLGPCPLGQGFPLFCSGRLFFPRLFLFGHSTKFFALGPKSCFFFLQACRLPERVLILGPRGRSIRCIDVLGDRRGLLRPPKTGFTGFSRPDSPCFSVALTPFSCFLVSPFFPKTCRFLVPPVSWAMFGLPTPFNTLPCPGPPWENDYPPSGSEVPWSPKTKALPLRARKYSFRPFRSLALLVSLLLLFFDRGESGFMEFPWNNFFSHLPLFVTGSLRLPVLFAL